MSVTELRDQQNDEWHAWADRDPDRVREHNAKRRNSLARGTTGKRVRLCEFVSSEGEPCLRKHQARGLCTGHYKHLARYGEPKPLQADVPVGTCEFAECDRGQYAKRLCRAHYCQRWRGEELRPLSSNRHPQPPAPGARDGRPWIEWEFDLVMGDTPLREVALRLGRTYSSVVRARQRRRKMLGLDITRIKTEADPYDGSDRAGVLIEKEK